MKKDPATDDFQRTVCRYGVDGYPLSTPYARQHYLLTHSILADIENKNQYA